MTLVLDATSQAWFDAQRSAHFPPNRLVVGAHVTMFHALPAELQPPLAACIAMLCRDAEAFEVSLDGLRSLGRGVAFALRAPQAAAIRATIATAFAGHLTAQDRQRWSPHVTVQNKVTAERALRTMALLEGMRPPRAVIATGLALWHYRGGPWENLAHFGFGLDGQPA